MVTIRDECNNLIEKDKEVRLEDEWVDENGIKLYLESRPGDYNGIRKGFEDRVFMIRTTGSFQISHKQQMEIMERILKNDIYPNTFIKNNEKFLNKINEIKEERRELELKRDNIDINILTNHNLWMNKNGKV